MKQGKAILVTLVLASLLWPLGALPVQAMTTVAQAGVKPDAQIAIVEVRTLIEGAKRSLKVGWKVLPQGGAVPLGFDVVARLKFTNGALDIVSKSVGGDIRSVVFDGAGTLSAKLNQSVAQKGVAPNSVSGNLKEADKAKAKAKEKDKEKATEKSKKPIAESKTVTPRAASLPGDGGGKPLPGGGGGGVGAIIEEATVTVTGRFSGGAEALNVLREFEPPALNPTGELRPRSGAGNGDVQITKLIELAKSPRAAQCPKGRDCFEVQTGNRDFTGNGGFNVNLEVLYADGTRKTAAAALTAPGRPLVLSVDKPAAAFTSVKVRIRGNGDGVFTRSATRNELLAT